MRFVFAAILVLFTASCATVPSPSETSGGLLVIPLDITKEGPGNFSFVYTMEIADTNGSSVAQARIDPMVHKNIYVSKPLPVGIYQIKELYSRPQKTGGTRYTYKDNAVAIELYFEIKEDQATVLDHTFMVYRQQKDDRSFSTWWNFTKGFSTDSKEDQYRNLLSKRFAESGWQLQM